MFENNELLNRITAVAVVHLVIYGIQLLSNRFVPELKTRQYLGIYMILMPLGFGLFGWDLPYWGIAPLIIGGVYFLLVVFKMALNEDRLNLDD